MNPDEIAKLLDGGSITSAHSTSTTSTNSPKMILETVNKKGEIIVEGMLAKMLNSALKAAFQELNIQPNKEIVDSLKADENVISLKNFTVKMGAQLNDLLRNAKDNLDENGFTEMQEVMKGFLQQTEKVMDATTMRILQKRMEEINSKYPQPRHEPYKDKDTQRHDKDTQRHEQHSVQEKGYVRSGSAPSTKNPSVSTGFTG